ncbi:VOC family protein [Streptomyces sp. NRRL B-24484]|uniref:VOC family protein n=1 Tax=Streptomyces sp. NRRL B-24484 TaxID=1463833 RepID=UPI0004BE8939|nr:VOC family protein [Streptomyces sp. NRRL B-24484]
MEQSMGAQEVSDAVGGGGWRLLLGTLQRFVPVASAARAVEAVAVAVAVCGEEADRRLRADLRPGVVVLALVPPEGAAVGAGEVELARRISAALCGPGADTGWGEQRPGEPRSVQLLEIAVDVLDAAAVRPFWKAVLGHVGVPGADGPEDPLVDPLGQGPAVWFQRMDAPRVQRNRLHLDVTVPHDEALRRVGAAVAAGGRVVSAARAPAWWVLADPEGNEVCVSTWQGREEEPQQ